MKTIWKMTAATLLAGSAMGAYAEERLSQYTENNLSVVLMHELAHGLIREFKIPVLGNEEVMADMFAAYIISSNFENVEEIYIDRIAQMRLEDDQTSDASEYLTDAKRAGQMACFVYGTDPAEREKFADVVGLSDDDKEDCGNRISEVFESWRYIAGAAAGGGFPPELIFGEGPMEAEARNSTAVAQAFEMIGRFAWPQSITLHVDNCDGNAYWNRDDRKITLCHAYIDRFERKERR